MALPFEDAVYLWLHV